ncbi:MAG TPA: DUF3536 domain-containing protein, partial [Gemmatimonadaceae bacterium]|nr:DUF3536 domain-containing protein [Gemmatimonadaceae bacterium]
GIWLPETAVDEETLDVLAEEGLRFTILSPYQVRNPDPTGRPLRWRAANGRELALFTYDGPLAGEVAFGGLLRDPPAFAARLARWDHDPSVQATVLATDGETFGHHHRGGEVALARAIARMAARPDVRVHNFSSLLDVLPPTQDAELIAPSAWSCAHGVERWRSDCGCRLDPGAGTSQAWRGPLRRALTWLANEAHTVYALEAPALFVEDPWRVRDAYGTVVACDGAPLEDFARAALHADRRDEPAAVQRALELLELERAALRLFTSCAWFFDDVARIETRQVLRYAARVLELSGRAARLEPMLLERLGDAVSNDPRAGTAADLFVRGALPHRSVEARVAAGVAALVAARQAAASRGDPEASWPSVPERVGAFDVQRDAATDPEAPISITVRHRRTGRVSTHHAVTLGGTHGVPRVSLRTVRRGRLETPTLYDVRDFPESIARPLLARFALTPFPDAPFESFTPR